jgi:membrane-associated protein
MIEPLLLWLCEHAENAHWIIFWMLVIAGFSLPISEDLLLIASGVLASTIMPERTVHLFFAALLGSYLSDWIAYGIGRGLGSKIYAMKWFARAKKERLEAFYQKYGFWTLMVGRCIPFGLRNGIFMAAGAGKMPFGRFLLIDGLACLLFSTCLFYLAYVGGQNYEILYKYVYQAGVIVLAIIAFSVLFFWLKYRRRIGTKDSKASLKI